MINTEADTKQQIVSSTNSDYLMGISDDNTGFSRVYSWEILDYLYTNSGNIKYEDLVMKKLRLTNPFDPTQPILNLFNRHKNIRTLATKGGQKISAQENISLAYVLLKESGAYDRAVEDWYNMTEAHKKWDQFKTHFITAYQNLKKQIKGHFNNIMNREITALIADELQKFATQFDEVQQKLANFSEANKTLKELVEACKKQYQRLEVDS